MNCAICHYGYGDSVEANVVFDGVSLCDSHALEVAKGPYRTTDSDLRFDGTNKFTLIGTIQAIRQIVPWPE